MSRGREGLAWLVLLANTACATIHTTETITDTPLPPTSHQEVLDGSAEYTTSATVHGTHLRIAIEQTESCATTTTQRSHRRRYVTRTSDATTSRAIGAVAVVGLATGIYSFGDAEGLAAQADGPLGDASATEYRQYGGGVAALGLLATAIVIIDGIRAADSEHDDGVIEGESTRREFSCRHAVTSNRAVALLLSNEQDVAATTDDEGVADLAFLHVSDDGVSGLDAIYLRVAGKRIPLRLLPTQIAELRANLLADPESRLAQDVLAKRRAECTAAIAAARATIAPEPADVLPTARRTWIAAKATCTDLWTASDEAELQAVDDRVVYTECRTRLQSAASAFVDETGTTVEEMTAELSTLRELCTTPEHIAQRTRLDAKLAAAIKTLERQQAAEARRIAREEARAAAEFRKQQERARTQRSFPDPEPAFSTDSSRACCKYCSKGKACGNTCIARWKTCHVGQGCACDE